MLYRAICSRIGSSWGGRGLGGEPINGRRRMNDYGSFFFFCCIVYFNMWFSGNLLFKWMFTSWLMMVGKHKCLHDFWPLLSERFFPLTFKTSFKNSSENWPWIQKETTVKNQEDQRVVFWAVMPLTLNTLHPQRCEFLIDWCRGPAVPHCSQPPGLKRYCSPDMTHSLNSLHSHGFNPTTPPPHSPCVSYTKWSCFYLNYY